MIINAAAATHGDVLELTRGDVVAVQLLLAAMNSRADNGRFIQIGSAAEYGGVPRRCSTWARAKQRSPGRLSHRLIELSGTTTKLVEGQAHAGHAGSPADAVAWQQADTTLISKHLGWSSKIPLDQSLADT